MSEDLVTYLADRAAIEELTARYNRAWDEGRSADWAATFTPDGALDVVDGDVVQGTEALAAANAGAEVSLFHVTTNAVIEIDGDTATQEVQLLFFALDEDRTAIMLQSSGRYSDDLVRTPDGWRFKRRRALIHIMPDPETVAAADAAAS